MVLPGSRRVPRVPRYSGSEQGSLSLVAYGAFTLCRRSFQIVRLRNRFVTPRCDCSRTKPGPATPPLQRLQTWHNDGLGSSLFARRYWGNRVCFLFLRVLRWFTSPGWLRHPMNSDGDLEDCPRGVAPFGDLRVKACLRLTEAYRSLPRPSSPACAKASTVRP
jgi:hypothetical protein